ncbi:porin family protein [Hymenobacter sp. BRD67]|uniref:porin family protein n=1 Tax=Hymenobacter sp. BRD67 TaxID=2675877 RepID=UPI001566669E|nr:porin family protein [Hymenobacter sp. BRD67]QKG54240.1 PorT family protein [Hymenobacter sp. BRD67]
MKYLLLLLVSLAATEVAHAQVRGLPSAGDYSEGQGTTSRNTGFGIKGGLSYSDLKGSGAGIFTNLNQLKTFHAGVYGQYGFTHFASVQVELLYSRKGFQADSNGLKSQQTTQLNYIELPILFVGNITETLSIHLGPQVSMLSSARTGSQDLDIGQSGYNRFDFGGIVGAEARLGPARVGVRYDLSFANLYKSGSAVTYNGHPISTLITDNNIRNSVLQVYLGIGIAH